MLMKERWRRGHGQFSLPQLAGPIRLRQSGTDLGIGVASERVRFLTPDRRFGCSDHGPEVARARRDLADVLALGRESLAATMRKDPSAAEPQPKERGCVRRTSRSGWTSRSCSGWCFAHSRAPRIFAAREESRVLQCSNLSRDDSLDSHGTTDLAKL